MHNLILGMTLSGKSTLAKGFGRVFKREGHPLLVLDPTMATDWNADFITDDPEKFLKVFWQSRSCMCFIDEAGESVGRYNDAMNKTATKGRHCGHTMHYIAQRGMQLSPLVRDQCTGLFLFASSRKDGKILAEEWNHDELETCNLLLTGEHFQARKMGACKRVDMFGLRSKQDAATDSGRSGTGDDTDRGGVVGQGAGDDTQEEGGEGGEAQD